jgi:O-antigen/teichoic acid export membrane protein
MGAGYVILANLAMAALKLLLLLPELLSIRLQWDSKLWKEMMIYTLPLMIAGFGGMVNETFDRIMLGWWAPVSSVEAAKVQVGIYSACYKLSILITLFIQAFRMGAEPFFFQQSKGEDAPKTYARVMNYFVITICLMFLAVALYLDVWKELIRNPQMWEGLKIVPILLVANMCLGVYYNLSIWYKLSQNTRAGATITFIGAGITLLINAIFIPQFGYIACAWATLACYGSMMLISYAWGQKVYPVPYAVGKLSGFFIVMLLCFFVHQGICAFTNAVWLRMLGATVLFAAYFIYILKKEGGDLKRLPVIGKYLR